MSEMTGPPAAGGKKILGLKPKTLIIGSVVLFGGVLGYLWWRSRQAKASSASTGTSASASAGAYNAATLAGLQDELEELLSQQGGSASTGTGAGGGSTLTTTPTTTSNPPPAKTTTPPKTTTPAPAKKTPAPAMPAAHETKVTATSVTIAWDKVANATSYRVRVTYQSKLVGTPHVVTGTSATISGLAPLRTYTFHVAAIGPGGTSSETNGPAVKTK
jgi:hypothetical protein